ncbi:hypothetical protein CONPUDRAFT_77991 [Coniophora puteana RWD-64-598 SS2]|uniref:Uncharacterized protein n=1 Tax=Coniophora puteana (strain RWD-64-598) TaxID=741705 RepID=R7SDS1_CONPW|nr:uncharacterized protein CONPUDRAFT_77991 [Coniophora puteana RWD-64-598 SS2]EIW74313.1 hypothetical protein CONPUDRAFT_77991 [Coniophora puteana RWD-64-598 SS2]
MSTSTLSAASKLPLHIWVRAPDLSPNSVIQGDVRVKAETQCPEIENIHIGLRYKECSFAKSLRDGAVLPENNEPDMLAFIASVPRTPWKLPMMQGDPTEYIKSFEDKSLWQVREEERKAFEVKYPLTDISKSDIIVSKVNADSKRDIVQKFALMIPNSNYPPAPDPTCQRVDYDRGEEGTKRVIRELVNVESLYEYFAEVHFKGEETTEVPVGYTAFQPETRKQQENATAEKISVPLKLENIQAGEPDPAVSKYSVDLIYPLGSSLTAGETSDVQVVVHRTGVASAEPIEVSFTLTCSPKYKVAWASKYIKDPGARPTHLYSQQLDATLVKTNPLLEACAPDASATGRATIPASSPEDLAAGSVVSTSSAPVTVALKLNERTLTDFETHYATYGSELKVKINVPRGPAEAYESSNMHNFFLRKLDLPTAGPDEYDWVPWERTPEPTAPRGLHIFEGSTRIAVLPRAPPKTEDTGTAPVHYLSPNAKTPIFINPADVDAVLAKTPAERDTMAPVANARLREVLEEDVLVHRYMSDKPANDIYVGKTWKMKVVDKEKAPEKEKAPSALDALDWMSDHRRKALKNLEALKA